MDQYAVDPLTDADGLTNWRHHVSHEIRAEEKNTVRLMKRRPRIGRPGWFVENSCFREAIGTTLLDHPRYRRATSCSFRRS